MPPFPPSSACGAQEEPQQQQPVIIPSSTTLRWNPSPTDTRCRVNEDAECRFQQLSGSVHKVGMVLDSVQTDVIQLNRTMKDASVESGGVQQKFDLLEDTLQKIIKGQNDLKVLAENSMKSNSDQLNVLNSRTSKLNEMSLVVSVCPKQVQADLRELHGDIFRVLTKDMEGVVRDIRSLNTRPAAMSMLPNPMLAKGSPLMNGVSVANRRPTMNQTPAANERPLMNQSPVANGRSTMNQTPVANGRSLMNQTPVKNGSPMTIPVGDGRSQLKQTPVTDGTPPRDLTPEINGRPQKDRIPVANGRPHMEQIPATKPLPARSTYATRASVLKPKVEEGMVKAAHMVGTSYRLAPAQKEKLNQKVNPQETTKKEPVKIIIDDSEHGTSGAKAFLGQERETLMNGTSVANGRPTVNQTPVANGLPLMNQTPAENGSPMIANQAPVGDGRSQLKQTPATDGTTQRDLTPEISGTPQKDQIPVANGRPHMEQIPATKPLPACSTYTTRLSVLKPKVEQGKVKAAHMVGTSYRLAPSQKEELNQKVNPQEPTKKEPVNIIIGSDNDNKGCTSGGILNMEAADLRKEVGSESGPQLVWGARKMRTSSETLPIDAATLLPGEGEKRRRGPGRDTQKGEAVHAVEATPAKRAHRFNPKYDATLWITC
ncbi:unnamed protein product [Triticum turgidum subsp. durum]|uniref:Protein PAIR1 n=1 Tax=Triticum turgidum subsp. durum TaxID=4567 RepID=A0A9R1PBL4_TRITD|nr:unnamed protein product [Triticum turgidum subsp. durum]